MLLLGPVKGWSFYVASHKLHTALSPAVKQVSVPDE